MLDEAPRPVAHAHLTDEIRRGTASPVSPSALLPGPEALDEAQSRPVRKHSQRWHVVMHKPFEGWRARQAIQNLGFQAHWPREVIRRRCRNDELVPLFPGYLFALFDIARAGWGRIAAHDTVVAIVGLREVGHPIPVPQGVVEHLIARAGAIDLPIDRTADAKGPAQVLDVGDEVMVLDRELFDRPALLRADRGRERVEVLMTMLGAERSVQVRRSAVRRVP